MRGKRFTAVLLSAVLTAAGAMTAWALPTGSFLPPHRGQYGEKQHGWI